MITVWLLFYSASLVAVSVSATVLVSRHLSRIEGLRLQRALDDLFEIDGDEWLPSVQGGIKMNAAQTIEGWGD